MKHKTETSSPLAKRRTKVTQSQKPPMALAVQLPGTTQTTEARNEKNSAMKLQAVIEQNIFKPFGGSEKHDFNLTVSREVLSCLRMPEANVNNETIAPMTAAAGAALEAFKPADEIEGMLAAQAVALHFTAMDCLRRSMLPEQPSEIATRLRKDAANLMRTMTDMLEALDRKRGKGPQVVRVERVVVHEGGQAIVGNVAPRGEG